MLLRVWCAVRCAAVNRTITACNLLGNYTATFTLNARSTCILLHYHLHTTSALLTTTCCCSLLVLNSATACPPITHYSTSTGILLVGCIIAACAVLACCTASSTCKPRVLPDCRESAACAGCNSAVAKWYQVRSSVAYLEGTSGGRVACQQYDLGGIGTALLCFLGCGALGVIGVSRCG